MSYDGAGELSARLARARETPTLMIGSTKATFVATGSQTEGRFGLFHWEMPPRGSGAQAHFHRGFSEAFYVLDGHVELFDGQAWSAAAAHDFLYVPAGGIHGFRNASAQTASMLILFAPGAPRERYFEELAGQLVAGATLDDRERAAFLAHHDQYMV